REPWVCSFYPEARQTSRRAAPSDLGTRFSSKLSGNKTSLLRGLRECEAAQRNGFVSGGAFAATDKCCCRSAPTESEPFRPAGTRGALPDTNCRSANFASSAQNNFLFCVFSRSGCFAKLFLQRQPKLSSS